VKGSFLLLPTLLSAFFLCARKIYTNPLEYIELLLLLLLRGASSQVLACFLRDLPRFLLSCMLCFKVTRCLLFLYSLFASLCFFLSFFFSVFFSFFSGREEES